MFFLGAIGAIRTPDLLLRRQLLYPAELQPLDAQFITHENNLQGKFDASSEVIYNQRKNWEG